MYPFLFKCNRPQLFSLATSVEGGDSPGDHEEKEVSLWLFQ